MSNLSSSFIFQIDMLKRLEDMFWTGSGHVLKTCPSAKMPYLSRNQTSPLSVIPIFDGPRRTWELDQESTNTITNGQERSRPTKRMWDRQETREFVGAASNHRHQTSMRLVAIKGLKIGRVEVIHKQFRARPNWA